MGSMEMTKALYESGLQNIYNDYQKNIDILNENEKRQLQNAYTQNQMAKKYLGEYASNTDMGIGDVSGNLLDIYSNYQKNVAEINANTDNLEMNLAKEYQTNRLNTLTKIMETELQIDAENMAEESRKILYEISTGELGGLSEQEYLDNALANGRIDEATYQQFKLALYEEENNKALGKFESGNYGYKTNEDGERVKITDPMEYLETLKGKITEKQYKEFEEMLTDMKDNEIEFIDLKEKHGAGFNPGVIVDGTGIESDAFQIGDMEYYQVLKNITEDEFFQQAGYEVTNEELFEKAGGNPVNRQIVSDRGMFFEYKDGQWYRLASSRGTTVFKDFINDNSVFGKNGKGISLTENGEYEVGKDKDGNRTFIDYDDRGKGNDIMTLKKEIINDKGEKEIVSVALLEQDYKDKNKTNRFKLTDKDKKLNSEFLSVKRRFEKEIGNSKRNKKERMILFHEGAYWVYDGKNESVVRMVTKL